MKYKKIVLVTGCAGFIGYHVSKTLMSKNIKVIGIDNINSYYDVLIKKARLTDLKNYSKKKGYFFYFKKIDIDNEKSLKKIFKKYKITHVIHLAAQAGVRYSIVHPEKYIQSNIKAFFNVLNYSKIFKIKHLLYASTSSVYGANKKMPFTENDIADHPIQLYAATKRSNELMAHSYSHLFNLPTTGLRFFTVYGPWGRPDMALFKFTKNILENKPIEVYNYGNHSRDFTYIDDVSKAIKKLYSNIPKKNDKWNEYNPVSSASPFRILNIGNGRKVKLLDYIKYIENNLGKKAIIKYLPKQPGDVPTSLSNSKKLKKLIKYIPQVSAENGVKEFIKWYKSFYKK